MTIGKDLADGGLDPYETIPVSEPGGSVDGVNGVYGGWGPLEPFGSTGELPPFPVEALPGRWAEFVRGLAESTQTPVDMAAMVVLGVLATCLQGRYRVHGNADHFEILSLWVVVVIDPANRKSTVLARTIAPILAWERRQREELADARSNRLADREAIESEIKRVRKRTAKAEATEGDHQELAALKARLAELPVPFELPVLVGGDTTPEVLGIRMEQQGRYTLASAEGDEVFSIAMGRYGEGPNLDLLLKGHAGDMHRVDRVGRPSLYIPEAVLSLILMVQESVLEDRAGDRRLAGRGFLARCCWCRPVSPLGTRVYVGAPSLDPELLAWYERAVSALLDLPVQRHEDGRWDTRTIELSPAALSALDDWHREIEPETPEGGRFEDMTGWAGKLLGCTLRVSALLHAAESPTVDPSVRSISGDTMDRAVTIARYLVPQAESALMSIGTEDETTRLCLRVLRWVGRTQRTQRPHETTPVDVVYGVYGGGFTERDVWQSLRRQFGEDISKLRPVLEELARRNYLVAAPEERRTGRGGKPSPRWYVNPAVFAKRGEA
jgi:hypothetical protein